MDMTPASEVETLLKDTKEFIELLDHSIDILGVLEEFLYIANDIIENIELDMKYHIEYQDQFFKWHHYQTVHNEQNAYRTATNRLSSTGKKHRITDDDGHIIDIIG